MDPKKYRKLKNRVGIYQNKRTKRYYANKRVKGKMRNKSFDLLEDALVWRNKFKGSDDDYEKYYINKEKEYSTLSEVWSSMKVNHFPSLSPSTIQVWKRRYTLLHEIEHLPMNKITSSLLTSWINKQVQYFKSDEYGKTRGNARRCNLNNELNLLKTIFNWYKQSIEFEQEAINLVCPVRKKHKKKGFIKPKPIKDMNISIEDAFTFFNALPQPHSDLAKLQYFTASRIGEVAGLQWNRINMDKNRMIIMETCNWDMTSKTFIGLNLTPKNKTPREVFITPELKAILERREALKVKGNNFVFHIEGKPLNYGTIQVNYRRAQRKTGLSCTGTHILRYGMAKLARRVAGGLDAVIAMTGHKDIKLADHYSKLDNEYQKEISQKIMNHISSLSTPNNVISITEKNNQNVVSLNEYRQKNNC